MPDPVDLFVIQELRAYLIAQGVAQDQNTAPSTVVPSIWLAPRQGAPEPRRQDADWLEEATVTLADVKKLPPPNLGDILEEAFVEIMVRARGDAQAQMIHRQIRGLIVPEGANGGQRQLWMMNDLLVEYSRIWVGEQPTPTQGNGETYDRVAAYCFGCRRKALRGLPYAD